MFPFLPDHSRNPSVRVHEAAVDEEAAAVENLKPSLFWIAAGMHPLADRQQFTGLFETVAPLNLFAWHQPP